MLKHLLILLPLSVMVFSGEVISQDRSSSAFLQFDGKLKDQNIKLQWTISGNESVDQFELQRSGVCGSFNTVGYIFTSEKQGAESYQFPDILKEEKYNYRLKMVTKSGEVRYSKILSFEKAAPIEPIKLFSNPVTTKLSMSFQSTTNLPAHITIMGLNGKIAKEEMIPSVKGVNNATIYLPAGMIKGIYLLVINDGQTQLNTRFIKE
jgi:hypothetical protein